MSLLPSFPQWQYLAKLLHNNTPRILTLIQSRPSALPSPKGFLLLLCYSHTCLPPSSPSLATPTSFSISRTLHFKMLPKRHYTLCNILGLAFSLNIILWRFIQGAVCSRNYVYCCVVFHGMDIPQFVLPATH